MPRLPTEPPASDITPEPLYARRREFLKNTALFAGTSAALGAGLVRLLGGPRATPAPPSGPLFSSGAAAAPSAEEPPALFTASDPRTPYDAITTYSRVGGRRGGVRDGESLFPAAFA